MESGIHFSSVLFNDLQNEEEMSWTWTSDSGASAMTN